MTDEQQDALTMVAHKAKDIFVELYDELIKKGFDMATAKEIALALTPKPVEILTAIYIDEPIIDEPIIEEPPFDEPATGSWTDAGGIPDDAILKNYTRGNDDSKKGN